MKMEWTEDHDIQLAKEFLEVSPTASNPELCRLDLIPAVRIVERAKIWQFVDRR